MGILSHSLRIDYMRFKVTFCPIVINIKVFGCSLSLVYCSKTCSVVMDGFLYYITQVAFRGPASIYVFIFIFFGVGFLCYQS